MSYQFAGTLHNSRKNAINHALYEFVTAGGNNSTEDAINLLTDDLDETIAESAQRQQEKNMNYQIEFGYVEVKKDDVTYFLQLPVTPDSEHSSSAGDVSSEIAKTLQTEIEEDFENRTIARLSYAAGELVESYEEDGETFVCQVDGGELTLCEGRASNYYNVEYYENR